MLIASWGSVLEAADLPPTLIIGAHCSDDETVRIQEHSPGVCMSAFAFAFDPLRFAAHEKFFVDDVRRWARTRFGVSLPARRTAVCGVSAPAPSPRPYGTRPAQRSATTTPTPFWPPTASASSCRSAATTRGPGRSSRTRWSVPRRTLVDAHPHTIGAAHNLATTWDQLVSAAYQVEQDRMRELFRCQLGEDHPDTLLAESRYAINLGRSGNPGEVRNRHAAILARLRERLGDDHPDTLSEAGHLAAALHALRARTVLGPNPSRHALRRAPPCCPPECLISSAPVPSVKRSSR